jgi:glycerol-3-phosphate dehydrogenase
MENKFFTLLNRKEDKQQLQNQIFDVLVIGGGITGAGIALDAATRGLKVALVEKKDFAWGTSSRSTKLIHGGLRYLKQLEIKLVREVGLERAIVHENARHVVVPERMLLPIVQGGSLGKTLSSIGLWVYDYLAKVQKDERRKMLQKSEIIALEPLLRTDILTAGGLYYEYRTDDARLTIENLKSAHAFNATIISYTEVENFINDENEKVCGVQVKDLLDEQIYNIKADFIINAAGPWVDTLREKDSEGVQKKRLHLTKGVHIVVPFAKLPLRQSVYFDTADKRMCFAIPRENITYIGTTDTSYNADINQPLAQLADVDYILNATNAMFPNTELNREDVISTWAGLRPLIHQDGRSPSELSRKDEIFISKTGLISMAGGKLTGYRKMSEKVINLICKQKKVKNPCITADFKISGANFDSGLELDKFINLRAGSVKDLNIQPAYIVALAHKYGSNIDLIIEKCYELKPRFTDWVFVVEAAEIWYAIHYEYVCNLCDYVVRRTGRLYFERPSISAKLAFWADEMALLLNWSAETKQAAIDELNLDYQSVMQWKMEIN